MLYILVHLQLPYERVALGDLQYNNQAFSAHKSRTNFQIKTTIKPITLKAATYNVLIDISFIVEIYCPFASSFQIADGQSNS